MYVLEIDVPAGTYEKFSCKASEECAGCKNSSLCFKTEEGREAELARLSGPIRYAIFENRPTGEKYYKPVDNFSGNWKGSQEYPFSYSGVSLDTEEEARNYVRKHTN